MLKRHWISWFVLISLVVVALATVAGGCSTGPAYPSKAIEVVVPIAAGGGSDTMGRVVVKYMAAQLGVPVNIVNKPGGNQIPGVMEVHQAAPDGYSLLFDTTASSSLMSLLPDLPFKVQDRTFMTRLTVGKTAFFVNGKSPYNSLKEVMEAAKKDPASFTWTYLGGSTITDFSEMALLVAAGVDVAKTKPVSFSGAGPGQTAVAGGHVVFGAGGTGGVLALASSGDLKVIGVAGDKRSSALPNVQSAKEAGYDVMTMNTYGFSGPKGLPKEVIDRIDAAAKKVVADPAFGKDVDGLGSEVNYLSPEQVREMTAKEIEQYRALAAKFPKL